MRKSPLYQHMRANRSDHINIKKTEIIIVFNNSHTSNGFRNNRLKLFLRPVNHMVLSFRLGFFVGAART